MEAPKNHLRFDISEKVRLQPQQPGIGSLLDLDLYPDVEIQDQGEHLIIQGHLRLYGSYVGDNLEVKDQEEIVEEESAEEIAYVIPVEITLPRNRAETDYISAEVETFDYQVLSPFELQIEAILLIDGILPEQQEIEVEPATFSASEIELDHSDESENTFASEQEKLHLNDASIQEIESQAEKKDDPSASLISEENERKEDIQLKPVEDHSGSQEEVETQEELRSEEKMEETQVDHNWKHWLLKESKEERFTPLRMVIVQKEDSIQSIADRYQLPTTQIFDYNQLESEQLAEGQILYLPTQSEEV